MPAAIRLARPSDGPAVAAIYAPCVATPISFELEAPDGAEMSRRIERTLARTPWLVCVDAADLLGYAYATGHRERAAYAWSVEVSAYVHERARRRGVARALYASLCATLEAQGFRNAYAGIALPNEPSVALHEASGFGRVGVYRAVGYKLGAWHDVLWMERALAPRVVDPAPPIALPALAETTREQTLAAGMPLLRERPDR